MPFRHVPLPLPTRQFGAVVTVLGIAALFSCAEPPTFPISDGSSAVVSKGAGGGGKSSEVPVVSSLNGSGSIQADGGGDYVNGVSGVQSIIQAIGDWELDQTAKNATRTTRVDLTDKHSGPGTAPFAVQNVKGRFISKAAQTGKTYQGMQGGQVELYPLSLAFSYGGKNYGLRMNTANHAQTDYARVECIAADAANACTQWHLTPSGPDGRNIARLEEVTTKGNVLIGFYYISFDIVVSK